MRGPGALSLLENLLEMQNLGPIPGVLIQNLHMNKGIPGGFGSTLKFAKHGSEILLVECYFQKPVPETV